MGRAKFFLTLFSILFMKLALAYDAGDKKFEISGSVMASSESYELGADGRGAFMASAVSPGSGYSMGMKWRRSEADYSIDSINTSHMSRTPVQTFPKEVENRFDRFLFMIQPKSEMGGYGGEKGLKFNYGIESRTHSATKTTPKVYMPTRTQMGVRIGGNYYGDFSQRTYYEAGFGLLLPLYHDEAHAKTGYFRYSLSPDVSYKVTYQINSTIDIGAGVRAFYERTSYSGTGERGTPSATETFFDVHLPVELKIKF
jgi:hypothetical protein